MKRTKFIAMMMMNFICVMMCQNSIVNVPYSYPFLERNPMSAEVHVKIIIENNSDLDDFPDKSGGGIEGNPFIIKDFIIDAGAVGSSIFINNTDRYVIIQNCTVYQSGVTAKDAGIYLENATNVQIINCSIYGNYNGIYFQNSTKISILTNNITYNTFKAVNINSSSLNQIIGNKIINNSNDGCYSSFSNSNRYENNSLFNNTNGIFFTGTPFNNTLVGNNASLNRNHGIWFASNAINNSIMNNFAKSNQNRGIIIGTTSFNNTVDNNTCLTNSYHGIHLDTLSRFNIFTNNNFSYNSNYGMYFNSGSSNNTILGNYICYNGWPGIQLDLNNQNITISNNNVSYNSMGIRLDQNCRRNQIFNNTIMRNSDRGIFLSDAANNTIIENRIYNNSVYGIYLLFASGNNSIINNLIENNTSYGLRISSLVANNNTVTKNLIRNNLDYGLYIDLAKSTNVTENFIEKNVRGIELQNASRTTIWNNYIGNNTNQAYDYYTGTFNKWDNGSFGNFWTDFSLKYPTAIKDGALWNRNYTITGTGNNADRFPLTYFPLTIPSAPFITTPDQTISISSISITWIPIDTVQNYKVFVNSSINVTTSQSSAIISLGGNGTYLIALSSVNQIGESSLSSSITITVAIPINLPPGSTVPNPPIILTQNQTTTVANFTINWNQSANTDYYKIYINGTFYSQTYSTDHMLKFSKNGTYIIVITAVNSVGESEISNVLELKVVLPDSESNSKKKIDSYFGLIFILVGFCAIITIKLSKKMH